jgi:hypothetical protein
MHGEDLIRELGLGRGRLEELDRDLEDVIYKLETNQQMNTYLKEDIVHLLDDFWDLLARLDDLRYVEIYRDDDQEESEEEEGSKAASSPDGRDDPGAGRHRPGRAEAGSPSC